MIITHIFPATEISTLFFWDGKQRVWREREREKQLHCFHVLAG
jgi:hypothetical protein